MCQLLCEAAKYVYSLLWKNIKQASQNELFREVIASYEDNVRENFTTIPCLSRINMYKCDHFPINLKLFTICTSLCAACMK
jgi:hypothetical protein